MLPLLLALALVVPPAPAARVNDYARLLAAAERAALEDRLARHERATGAQMVIAIFRSLEGGSLDDVSIRLAEQWRIGQKALDNGVILVVFVEDRRMRMEVGYGLEAVVPDAVAGQIVREVMAPRFREERYAAGLEGAVEAVYARIAAGGGAPAAPPPAVPGGPTLWVLGLLVVFGLIGLVLMLEVFGSSARARRHGYTAGRRGWSIPPPRPGGGGGGRSAGGGFSGGGGRFGGGGASGSW